MFDLCSFTEEDGENPGERVGMDFRTRFTNVYEMLANEEFKPFGFEQYEIAIVDDTSPFYDASIDGACYGTSSFAKTLAITALSMITITGYYL